MKRSFRLSLSLAVALVATGFALIGQGQALAATTLWYVAPDGSDSNSCAAPTAPCLTINGAISKASAGDAVDVAVGTYTGSGTNVVTIDRDLILSGGWDSTFTQQTGLSTIDGQGAHRGVLVASTATATVSRFEVMNGAPPSSPDPFAQGGGILEYGPLTLDHSYVHDNVFNGVETAGAPLTITSSTVSGNQSGGVVLYNLFGNFTITITNSTIANNTGFYGGGIDLANLGSSSSVLTLNSDTITANSSSSTDPNSGGGISAPSGWDIEMENTIVSGNTAFFSPRDDIFVGAGSSVTSGGYNIGTGFSHTGTDSYDDPVLGSLADNSGPTPTIALLSGSPAIDAIPAGVNGCGTTITTDQRDVSRPLGPGCDIGAFELERPPVGFQDGASGLAKLGGCEASGWAQDPDAPTTHLNVRVLVDGVVVATTVADMFRQDLLDAGIGDGTFAFSVDLASLLSTDAQHQVRVHAQDSETGQWFDLPGTPQSLTCTQLAGSHDGNAGVQPKSACIATGWAWDADTPKTRLQVRVKVDGKVVAQTTADQFRADVQAAGFGDGYSGWTINLFGLATPRVSHLITAEERDATLKRVWLPLYGTDIYLTCTPT